MNSWTDVVICFCFKDGIPFANAVANIAFNSDNKVNFKFHISDYHSCGSVGRSVRVVLRESQSVSGQKCTGSGINKSLYNTESIASSTPTVSLDAAIKTAEDTLNGQFNNHPATLGYFAKADGSAVLTHILQIENETTGAWVEAFVDAHSGEVVSITDFVAQASVGFSTLVTTGRYRQLVPTVSCSSHYEGNAP